MALTKVGEQMAVIILIGIILWALWCIKLLITEDLTDEDYYDENYD